jgi:hypothetical protein
LLKKRVRVRAPLIKNALDGNLFILRASRPSRALKAMAFVMAFVKFEP